jgi:hypothetical protein
MPDLAWEINRRNGKLECTLEVVVEERVSMAMSVDVNGDLL